MPGTEGGKKQGGKEQGTVARAKAWVERVRASRPGRAAERYWIARGGLLAGGITYLALFSISAALTIGWTAFVAVLGGNHQIRQTVLDAVDEALPGLFKDEPNAESGIIHPAQLVMDPGLSLTQVVAVVVLFWTALRVMAALKSSVRAMFGIVAPPENPVLSKVRDLAGFVVLALGIVLAAALGAVASTLAEAVLGLVGVEGLLTRWAVRVTVVLVAFAVDWAIYLMLFRFIAGVRAPRRDLMIGAALGAAASGVLRLAGTGIVGAVDNPIIASFAALVTLLLWINLAARLALLVAAFTANPPAPVRPENADDVHLYETPNYVTESVPRTQEWHYQPLTGSIVPSNAVAAEEDPEPPPVPVRGGLVARLQRRRIARLERRLAKARESYAAGAGD